MFEDAEVEIGEVDEAWVARELPGRAMCLDRLRWICTLASGHTSDHVAHDDEGVVLDRWAQDIPEAIRLRPGF